MRAEQPELLAPAGNWDSVLAALANGADAVYFGADHFNARMRADNFTLDEMTALMHFLHAHKKRGYVALNVLIFPSEMQEALAYVRALDETGVDGVIVQDMGLAAKIAEQKRSGKSRLELHVSTQMSVTGPEGVQLVDELFSPEQIVLAREFSLREIEACAAVTSARIEVFCHGALCVAYSGQCLTSESLGCRSANRGECAQACRLPYKLEVDGQTVDLGGRRYLFSPQDLCSVQLVGAMLNAGVRSFKIEGRLKTPEYVAAVTRAYRRALDAAVAGEKIDPTDQVHDLYAMQMTFSRGFSTGWLEGTDHPRLTHGRFGKKHGLVVGRVIAAEEGSLTLDREPSVPLAPGDGFVLESASEGEEEQGGSISAVHGSVLSFHPRACHIRWQDVHPGQVLYKTADPSLLKQLRGTWSSMRKPETQLQELPPMRVHGRAGEPLELECGGVCVRSEMSLQPALKHPLTPEVVREKLTRLGGTGYTASEVECDLPDGLILPISELNRLRRRLLKMLPPPQQHRAEQPRQVLQKRPALPAQKADLSVLCRTLEQARAALHSGCGVRRLYLEPGQLNAMPTWVQELRREAGDAEIWATTLRVMKPHEAGYFKYIEQARPDGILLRNLGAAQWWLRHGAGIPLYGDFSLNTANAESVALWRRLGLLGCTISYDLNAEQIRDLLDTGCGPDLELTLHQHMPLFHCEHCVFCTFLSSGHSFKDCGHPCERHHVRIIDRKGSAHELVSDEGCRNTLFHARAQTAARCVFPGMRAGLSRFRVELLREDEKQTRETLTLYRDFLEGKIDQQNLIARLGAIDRPGVTEIKQNR